MIAPEWWRGQPPTTSTRIADLPVPQRRLLELIRGSVGDLGNLVETEAKPAMIRSLGYALHPLPRLVRIGEKFEPEDFQFNFRIAASWWSELPPSVREILPELAQISPGRVDRLIAKPGFTIRWG